MRLSVRTVIIKKQRENLSPVIKNVLRKWKWWTKEYVLDKKGEALQVYSR